MRHLFAKLIQSPRGEICAAHKIQHGQGLELFEMTQALIGKVAAQRDICEYLHVRQVCKAVVGHELTANGKSFKRGQAGQVFKACVTNALVLNPQTFEMCEFC